MRTVLHPLYLLREKPKVTGSNPVGRARSPPETVGFYPRVRLPRKSGTPVRPRGAQRGSRSAVAKDGDTVSRASFRPQRETARPSLSGRPSMHRLKVERLYADPALRRRFVRTKGSSLMTTSAQQHS